MSSLAALLGFVAVGAMIAIIGGLHVRQNRAPDPTTIPVEKQAQTIAAMKPPKRARPVVAVIAQNAGTETTDFIIPYAVLAQSGAADVWAVAPEAGRIALTPALTIEAQATTAEFDARYPVGADYVIVPKIGDAGDPAVVAWIQSQAQKGSTIVAICSGAKTVSAAGLLAGRSATGHWFDVKGLKKANPTMRWVPNRRYVADRGVVTTTGVSASVPVSLALVEAIAGPERAKAVATELGVSTWDPMHDSAAFRLDFPNLSTALGNKAIFWNQQTYTIPVVDGVDDVGLAFTADAWARTFRSKAITVAERNGSIVTRWGLRLVPDSVTGKTAEASMLPLPPFSHSARALPEALDGIANRYGKRTASFVALQLEYAWRPQ